VLPYDAIEWLTGNPEISFQVRIQSPCPPPCEAGGSLRHCRERGLAAICSLSGPAPLWFSGFADPQSPIHLSLHQNASVGQNKIFTPIE